MGPPTVHDLAIEIERTKGVQTAHEQVCAERYSGIISSMGDMKNLLSGILARVEGMAEANANALGVAQGVAQARKPKWWVAPGATIGAVLLAGVIGAFGWMASRIASDNDQRIADAKQHPAAISTVTVNPPAVAPAPPAPPAPSPDTSTPAS